MATLAIALMKKKHPEMKGPGEEPPMPEGAPGDMGEPPPSDEAIACAHDLIQAVHGGSAEGVVHAIQDLMSEIKGGGEPDGDEAAPDAGAPPEMEPPGAEE